MWHTLFISAHAGTATVAFVAGVIALRRGWLFGLYLGSLVGMEVFLVGAIAVEWSANDPATRALFAALAALGGVVVWRGLRARLARPPADADGPSARYFESVGFTLVALADAFVVIAVLNAGAPGWAVAATGIGIAIAGHFVLRHARRRLVVPDSRLREHASARGLSNADSSRRPHTLHRPPTTLS